MLKAMPQRNPWSQGKWQLDIYKGAKKRCQESESCLHTLFLQNELKLAEKSSEQCLFVY